jgi:ribose 5-phosphate isomerase A
MTVWLQLLDTFCPNLLAGHDTVPSLDDSPKARAAKAAANLIEDGMNVGLGSGSTAALMVRFLAARVVAEGLRLVTVATSSATAELASSLGIPLRELDEVGHLDLNLDGADEIDPQFRMIKGRGGALLREKIVASASARKVTIITADKRVSQLGARVPVPVEVSAFGMRHTESHLQDLGATTSIRKSADGSVYATDGGNVIIDCRFASPIEPEVLDSQLQRLAGVLDTGLFIGLCDVLIVASEKGVETIETGISRNQ